MAFNILMPLSSKPKETQNPEKQTGKAKYKEATEPIDYNHCYMRELSSKTKPCKRYDLRSSEDHKGLLPKLQ